MRYGNRNQHWGKKIFYSLLIFISLSLAFTIVVRYLAPEPMRVIIYDYFIEGKIIHPLVATFINSSLKPSDSKIPVYELHVDKILWNSLQEEGMESRRTWHNTYFSFSEARNIPVEIKIRGESQHNWIGVKKSLWIRTRAGATVFGMKKFSLRNPTGADYSLDLLAQAIAQKIGLMYTPVELVNVFINRQYNGIYLQIADESDPVYFKKNNRKASPIMVLDEINETASAFFDKKFWEIHSTENKKENKLPEKFLGLLACIKTRCQDFLRYVQIEQYIKNIILFELIGSTHLDQNHNHRIYFDPDTKMFEPSAWDLGSSRPNREFDQSFDFISQYILNTPSLREKKLQLQKELLETKITSTFLDSFYTDLLRENAPYFYADKYYGSNWAFSYYNLIEIHKKLYETLKSRRETMLANTKLSSGDFSLVSLKDGSWKFSANTPHTFFIRKVEAADCNNFTLNTISKDRVEKSFSLSSKLASPWEYSKKFIALGLKDQKTLSANLEKKPLEIEIRSSSKNQSCSNLKLYLQETISNQKYVLKEDSHLLEEFNDTP